MCFRATPHQRSTVEQMTTAIKKALLLLGLLALGWAVALYTPLGQQLTQPALLQAALEAHTNTAWGPALLALALAGSIVLGLPASALTLLGVALLPPLSAATGLFIGAGLGATITFALSRLMGQELAAQMTQRLDKRGHMATLEAWLERRGFVAVLYMRLCHIPYGLPGYLVGLSHMSWRPYLLASALGSVPHILAFVLVGSALNQALKTKQLAPLLTPSALLSAVVFLAVMALPLVWRPRSLEGAKPTDL